MKKSIVLLAAFCALVFTACNNDSSDSSKLNKEEESHQHGMEQPDSTQNLTSDDGHNHKEGDSTNHHEGDGHKH